MPPLDNKTAADVTAKDKIEIVAAPPTIDVPPEQAAPAAANVMSGWGSGPEILKGKSGNDYEVVALLGKGGMGVVYKAVTKALDRPLAIKIVHQHLVSDATAVKRFEREVQATSNLTHPNLAAVYDQGRTGDGAPFMVMDFIEGSSLSDIIRNEGSLAPSRVLDITLQVADALRHAHQKGIVHRDVKPSNIIIIQSEDGAELVKVVDFGIAKILPKSGPASETLTRTAQVLGTPCYMSPEQCLGHRLDVRSDIYSLGCVMYEALTGIPPFLGENPIQTIIKQINEEAPTVVQRTEPEIAERLKKVWVTALEKRRDNRYPTMHELRVDLLRIRNGQPPKGRRFAWWFKHRSLGEAILGGALIGAIVAAGFITWQQKANRGVFDQVASSATTVRANADTLTPSEIKSVSGKLLFSDSGAKSWNGILQTAAQRHADLSSADLREVNLGPGVTITGARLSQADFSNARLDSVRLVDCDLSGAKFDNAWLGNCTFENSNLKGANFKWATTGRSNPLRANSFLSCDLSGASFAHATLPSSFAGTQWSKAKLIDVSFKDADLEKGSFVATDLTGADFTGAKLNGTLIRDSSLGGAKFTRADLTDAVLDDAARKAVDSSSAP